MANNPTPLKYDPLVASLHNAIAGAQSLGAAIGLKQNDEATLRPFLEALIGGASQPGAKAQWNAAKARKVATTAAVRDAENRGRALAMAVVGVLKLRLGGQWNPQWHEAGFTAGSLQVSNHPQALLLQLRAYFLQHPDFEVPKLSDDIACTAAGCQAAADAIDAAKLQSQQSNHESSTAKQNLEQAVTAARARLIGLRQELNLLLGPDDARWYVFGFDRPNDPKTPAIPSHVTATTGAAGSGSLYVEFDDARRADSYRVVLTETGTDKVVAEKLVSESEATLTNLPVGISVTIVVTARNDAGESLGSEGVVVIS